MLDSDQEPSYNLSKNLLLLPRILKLIKDMVDDSTPLINRQFQTYFHNTDVRVICYKGLISLELWGAGIGN